MLSLVPEGTALEYYDLLKTRNTELPFSALVQRLSERFGQQALRPAANLEFNSMSQRVNETHEHWGDRVMTMAQQAFGSSTTLEVLHEQMVMRFALGCRDTEAGRYLFNVPPEIKGDPCISMTVKARFAQL